MVAGAPPAAQPGQKGQPPVRPRSFLVGTQAVTEGLDYDVTVNQFTSVQSLQPWTLQATGWLKGIWLLCTGTGGNTAAVTAFSANGPWNVFANIELDDVNNEAIFGPFDGYTAMVTNKLGGYQFNDDPRASVIYSTTTGSGATGGSFVFPLYIPLEIVSRDPLGPVPSVNNTASLTLKMTTNPLSVIYTTAPNGGTPLSFRVQGTQVFYWQPRKADKSGRPIMGEPPASGTTQYWTQGSVVLPAGIANQQLITGLGYPFRNYLMMLVDSAGSRAQGDADWPDPLIQLKFEANSLLSQYQKKLWQRQMGADYNYQGTTPDTLNSRENGVYALNFNRDFAFGKPGSETRRSYLVTSPGSNFIFNGTVGGSGNHTLYSIVNYVAPAGGNKGDTASLTGGQ